MVPRLLIPTSFCFSTIDRVVGLGLRTGRVESQRTFAVGPEVRPYPGAEGQSPNATGPSYEPEPRGKGVPTVTTRKPVPVRGGSGGPAPPAVHPPACHPATAGAPSHATADTAGRSPPEPCGWFPAKTKQCHFRKISAAPNGAARSFRPAGILSTWRAYR